MAQEMERARLYEGKIPMLTNKLNLSEAAILELRNATRKARSKMFLGAKYASGHMKTAAEQYASMLLAKAFVANDYELTGAQISEIHKAAYGSNAQNAGKLVWISNNKADPMPGVTVEALLSDPEYHDWIIQSTGAKGSQRYVAVQIPDYANYYGADWADNMTKPASGRGRKQKASKNDESTVEPVANTQSEVVDIITDQYADAPAAVETIDVEVNEQSTDAQPVTETVENVAPVKLSKNERRKLARAKAAAAKQEQETEEAA
jgi:hypothetical protein